jgi:uncharacterized protein YqgC (DUF456 family)
MSWPVWEVWVIASIAMLSGLAGVVFVVLALPGIWMMTLVSALCMWWQPEIISWKTVLTLVILGIISEAIDLFASAAGAKKFGGSKRGALGAIIGTIIGAIAGGVFLSVIPIVGWVIGPILGGILGAGAGALMVERSIVQQTWGDSLKSGGGAAVGRTISIFVKLGLTIVSGLFFVTAAFV